MVQGKHSRLLEKEDRISSLPDCLLIEIISRLPETKYAIRTGTLSQGWQYLWPQLPNLIIKQDYLDDFPQLYSSIQRIISQSNNPLNKFKLHVYYENQTKSQINNCIRNAINRNVQEFDFYVSLYPWCYRHNGFVLPEFFFICSSFIHLTLFECIFEQADVVSWDNLRTLHIEHVEIDQDAIKNILSGSPLLETLELGSCFGLERIDVTNKSVKNLALIGKLNDVVEINAPYILSLAFKGYLLLQNHVLLNVSSGIKAELDYSKYLHNQPEEMQEEMLKGLILRLGHVKEVKIGKRCSKVFTRLKAKRGLIFPSNIKYLHWCGPNEDEDEEDEVLLELDSD